MAYLEKSLRWKNRFFSKLAIKHKHNSYKEAPIAIKTDENYIYFYIGVFKHVFKKTSIKSMIGRDKKHEITSIKTLKHRQFYLNDELELKIYLRILSWNFQTIII